MIRTLVKTALTLLLLCGAARLIHGQAIAPPLPSFEVISIKPSLSEDPPRTIFPLGPGDVYVTNGGLFSAQNYPLATYIYFAFKVIGNEMNALAEQFPGWVMSEKFDIQARTDGDPAKDKKDQMRLMMRSLLVERFHLKNHYETRQVPIFAVSLAKVGKLGPQLQQHPADAVCNTVLSPTGGPAVSPTEAIGVGFPSQCGGLLQMPARVTGRVRFGARNVTMAFIANQLTALGAMGRPAVDQTGLTGTFDFVLEYVPEINGGATVGGDSLDPNGPTFSQAVREQLGLKLDSTKGPSEFLVIDHVERPSGN